MEIEKIKEGWKKLTPEQKSLFRQAMQEDSPQDFLSSEEVSTIREVLEGFAESKKKAIKKKGGNSILDFFDSLMKQD